MRKLNLLILLLAVFSLQSCFDVVEKMNVKKDGSGTYALSYDFSSILSNPMMKEMVKESLQSEDGPFADMMVDGSIEMDTLINLKDSPLATEMDGDMPEVMKKAKMAMNLSETQGVFKMVLSLDFDKVADIADFYKALQDAGDDQQGFSAIMPSNGLFELQGKTLTRRPVDLSKANDAMGDDESMGMMKMMMSGATYTTLYEFPKKVKSTTIPDAEVGKKTVKVTRDFISLMEGKGNLAGKIKFK
ncbi:MAG: hypothetical protein Sapg2KO_03360 [Saprospiraceae bacterium]